MSNEMEWKLTEEKTIRRCAGCGFYNVTADDWRPLCDDCRIACAEASLKRLVVSEGGRYIDGLWVPVEELNADFSGRQEK